MAASFTAQLIQESNVKGQWQIIQSKEEPR